MRILITGGTGSLGGALVRAVSAAGHAPRVLSRRARPQPPAGGGVEWARADVATGGGVREAVRGMDAVIHAASDPRRAEAVDVGGTRHIVAAACEAGVAHLVYVSIVGVDEIPYGYYRRKLAAEQIIGSSGVPHTVVRATQFHTFVELFVAAAARLPALMPLPTDFKFQSVEVCEVAGRLARCLDEGPRGRVTDFGGPEVLTLGEMAEDWMRIRGVRKRLIRLPIPGAVAAQFRAGKNTAPGGERGATSWREWLAARARAQAA